MASMLEQADEWLSSSLNDWNIYTTVILTTIIGLITFSIVASQDPDIHPFILSRQSTASLVRNPGESAAYRAPDTPHGFPLRTGLDVKEKDAHPYSQGRDGDLRDIWRRVTGELPPTPAKIGYGQHPKAQNGSSEYVPPKIFTILGTEKVVSRDIQKITSEIAAIGSMCKKTGKTVAIYMPNSVEFLTALFACAFYGLDTVLIPYNHGASHTAIAVPLIQQSKAEVLIAPAGSVALDDVVKPGSSLKQVIWFVEESSRQVDWTEVPQHVGGSVDVDTWHEICQNSQGSELPNVDAEDLGSVSMFWEKKGQKPKMMTFSHANLVAGISAQVNALPTRQRFDKSDLILPASPLSSSYSLCLTLAALFQGSSIALNSAVAPGLSLSALAHGTNPTIVVTTAEAATKFYIDARVCNKGPVKSLAYSVRSSSLANGHLDSNLTPLRGVKDLFHPSSRSPFSALRLLYIVDRAGSDLDPALSSSMLHELRIFAASKIVYALAAENVAGAVAQTNMYDYRVDDAEKHRQQHFGAPLSSVEVKLIDNARYRTSDDGAVGETHVSGPAVAGGEIKLDVVGRFRDDMTLAYV